MGFFSDYNKPKEQAQKTEFAAAAPFLIGSLVSWPTFWLYRGINWRNKRAREGLTMYVRRTYFQAKIMQLVIITTGILVALNHNRHNKAMDVHDI